MLALEERVVTHNVRISVVHEDMRTWRLRIKQLRESDRGMFVNFMILPIHSSWAIVLFSIFRYTTGCYMCQINASPMKKQIGCIDVQGKLV